MFLFRKITRVQDGRWIGEKNWSRKNYLGERRRDCILRPWGYRKVGEFKREGSILKNLQLKRTRAIE